MTHPLKNLRTQWHTQIPLARKELSFFISHWGKTHSMVAMSKKLQYHGLEELYQSKPLGLLAIFYPIPGEGLPDLYRHSHLHRHFHRLVPAPGS